MYYEERIIDGKLMCRGTPDGEWREVSLEVLTARYRECQHMLGLAHSRLLTFDVMSKSGKHDNVPPQDDLLERIGKLIDA